MGYKRVTQETLMMVELLCVLTVVVDTNMHTNDEITHTRKTKAADTRMRLVGYVNVNILS